MDVGIAVDEELDAARPARPVAQDGGRHDAPTEGLADDKGGGLALAEGAGGEVPEGILAAARFVDGGDLLPAVMHCDQKCIVGAVWQQPLLFDFPFYERAHDLVVGRRRRRAGARVLVDDDGVV